MDTMTKLKNEVALTAEDRCDRCGARAKAVASKEVLELLFCAHHARLLEPALGVQGFSVVHVGQ